MSKFTVKKSLIEINLDYIEFGDNEIILVNDMDQEKKDLYKERIKTSRAWFERPNWNNFNKFIKGCIEIDPITRIPIMDTITLRDRKFRNLLKRLIDGDGNEIFLDNEFFNNVLPEFAIALVKEYDEKLDKEKTEVLMNDDFFKKILEDREKEENQENQENEK